MKFIMPKLAIFSIKKENPFFRDTYIQVFQLILFDSRLLYTDVFVCKKKTAEKSPKPTQFLKFRKNCVINLRGESKICESLACIFDSLALFFNYFNPF